MPGVTAVAFAACLLLAAAGVAKLVEPHSLSRALRALALPGAVGLVRAFAAGETLLAATALVGGTRWLWVTVAASYAAFTGFAGFVRRRGGALAPCGCFGSPGTPATRLHVAINAGYAMACALAANADRPPSLRSVGIAAFVVVTVVASLIAYLSYVALAVLPRVRAAARLVTG